MLSVKPIMNSCVEAIFGFKTCCGLRAFDQNLEFLVTNQGPATVRVPSRCDLRGDWGSHGVEALMPYGVHALAPGQTMAFYCAMDEQLWLRSDEVVFFDDQGNQYACPAGARRSAED